METPIETVAAYYEQFGRRDEACLEYVDEGATFRGPAGSADGRAEIAELNAAFFPALDGLEVLHRSADGDTVASVLRFDLSTPAGEPLTIEMTAIDEVRDGRIERMQVYYDPRSFLEAFGDAEAVEGAA